MNKTPDEIKNGLECTINTTEGCYESECPYRYSFCTPDGNMEVRMDALAYIKQLEAANAELLTQVKQLEAKCHQLERERDAAVADLKYANVRGDCWHCKHENNPEHDADC